MTYKIERVVTQQPHVEYVTTEVTYNSIEQDTILDPLDVDTWVKLYRGFKYDYITCVRSTAPEVTIANQQAIADLLVLIQGITEEGSGIVGVQDEGVPVAAASNLNFVGDGVIAEIDPGDITGQTVMVTINGGGSMQNFKTLSFDALPELSHDDNIGDVLLFEVTDTELVSDVAINCNDGGGGGEGGGGAYNPLKISLLQTNDWTDGFTFKLSLITYSGFPDGTGIYIVDADGNSLEGEYPQHIESNTKIVWTFQKRETIELLSIDLFGISEGYSKLQVLSPFVRHDTYQELDLNSQQTARYNIGAVSQDELAASQGGSELANKYTNVINANYTPFNIYSDMFDSNGRAIVKMSRSTAQVANLTTFDTSSIQHLAGAEVVFIKTSYTTYGYDDTVINDEIGTKFYLRNLGDSITFKYTKDRFNSTGRWIPVSNNFEHYATGLTASGTFDLLVEHFDNVQGGQLYIETPSTTGTTTINLSNNDLGTARRGASFMVVNSGGSTVIVQADGSTALNGALGGSVTFSGQHEAKVFIKTSTMIGNCSWSLIDMSSSGINSYNVIPVTAASYTLQTSDNDGRSYIRMLSSSPNSVTITAAQTTPVTIRQGGVGQTVLIEDTGVTLFGTVTFAAEHDVKTVIPLGGGQFDVVG